MTTGDGIVAALQVLSALRSQNQPLAQLKAGLSKYPQVLVNVKVRTVSDVLNKPRIQQFLKTIEEKLANNGRVLLRRSGTESLVRVMVEGEDETQIKQLAHELATVVETEL
jgi:phosphoglucosamine mutase